MTSSAAALFTFKGFSNGVLPSSSDVGIATTLKKKFDDATISVTFSDASLKDPKSGQGVFVTAEKPLGEGIKGTISRDLGRQDTIATVTVDRVVAGNDLSLKALYRQKGDVFILEESWKFDKNNKLAGIYNFANEEAIFSYTYTKGDYKLGGIYNFQKDAPTLVAEKKVGKQTYGALYGVKDEALTLTWSCKPFKAALRGKAGRGGASAVSAALTATHEFEL